MCHYTECVVLSPVLAPVTVTAAFSVPDLLSIPVSVSVSVPLPFSPCFAPLSPVLVPAPPLPLPLPLSLSLSLCSFCLSHYYKLE